MYVLACPHSYVLSTSSYIGNYSKLIFICCIKIQNRDKIDHRLVDINRPILRVPNVAIHLDREIGPWKGGSNIEYQSLKIANIKYQSL